MALLTASWIFAINHLGAADLDPPLPLLQWLPPGPQGQTRLTWSLYPGADLYEVQSTTNLVDAWQVDPVGMLDSFIWTRPASSSSSFHRLAVTPVSSNALLTSIVLNRLAYGPTPDELERVLTGPSAIGPDAYIEEQLSPELIVDDIDSQVDSTNWTYRTATGAINGNNFIIYLSGAGQVRMDDMALVLGSEPEVGPNLLQNGDFELPTLDPWIATSNYAGSYIDTANPHSGSQCLVLDGRASGSNARTGFYQGLTNQVVSGQIYTLSYWYLPELENANRTLVVRVSGDPAGSSHSIRPYPMAGSIFPQLENRTALLADLRAWHVMHAVSSKHQLMEVLLQFLENHFVTEHTKIHEYFDRYYDGNARDYVATYLEYRERLRWRNALLNPQCTFYDLLKISAESPAMIIYLDTVGSRGGGNNIANENYARELLELFCNGVDNGYDQQDIEKMARVWTGWTVEIVDENQIDNPFAPRSTTLIDTNNINVRSNLLGVWTFNFNERNHDTNSKTIFPTRSVPTRFGEPWAGRPYELAMPSRSGADGILDGYEAIQHLANLPFTREFISVKLCRLFVHENFSHGLYDYTDPARSPEAALVHQCMLAWENSDPPGQIRSVLRTIFQSDLFRSHAAASQKIKTPLEFVVSVVRALRSGEGLGEVTARTDGYDLTGTGRTTPSVPLIRMGSMQLYDRAEPDGYPEQGGPWISAGTLAERIRFAQSFCIRPGSSGHTGSQAGLGNDAGLNSHCDPVRLLKRKLPSSSWGEPSVVTRFFLSLFYPAEGMGNLHAIQRAGMDFLNTAEDGVTTSPFEDLTVEEPEYDTRVRGLVAMLLSLPLMNEQ